MGVYTWCIVCVHYLLGLFDFLLSLQAIYSSPKPVLGTPVIGLAFLLRGSVLTMITLQLLSMLPP
jgi:hypothetical protein